VQIGIIGRNDPDVIIADIHSKEHVKDLIPIPRIHQITGKILIIRIGFDNFVPFD